MRNTLPQRRKCYTFKHRFRDFSYHVTTGLYPSGELGEVFLNTEKTGTQVDANARDFAIMISLLLQHGCSMETISNALTREGDGTPSTIAGAVADILGEKK